MSLSITASTDKIDCGSSTSLDNLQTMTTYAWVWHNTNVTGRMWSKGLFAQSREHGFIFTGGGARIEYSFQRATTFNIVAALKSNCAAFSNNKWVFVAAVSDTTVDANNKIYVGDLLSPVLEPSAYHTQSAGSGAYGDENTVNLTLGQTGIDTAPLNGKLAWVGLWNRQLSQAEIEEQRLWPHITEGCVLLQHLGENGLGIQYDKSLSFNNGTVTGCSVTDDPPLSHPSDEGFMLMQPLLSNQPFVTVW